VTVVHAVNVSSTRRRVELRRRRYRHCRYKWAFSGDLINTGAVDP